MAWFGMDYEKYIASPDWKQKRKQRLEIDGHRCRMCDEDGTSYQLEVHHRPSSYAKIPNESVEDDLTTACILCHQLITERIRRRRFEGQEINPQYHIYEAIERIDHGMEESAIPINFRSTSDNAQRRLGESPKPPGATDKEIKWQAKQDPGRPGTTS